MTQPDDIADQISRLAAGNSALVANPRALNGLVAAQATPQQAQAINQFLLGLGAQTQVANTPVGHTTPLPAQTKTAASAIGVSDSPAPKKSGWFDSFGSFFHHVTHNPVTNNPVTRYTIEPTLNALNAVGNASLTGLGNMVQGFNEDIHGQILPSQHKTQDQNQAEAAKAAGYDPSNPLSMIAYGASGQAKSDLTDLYQQSGNAAVDQAIQYAQDPEGFRQRMLFGANLTDEQRASNIKLFDVNTSEGKAFENLTLQVAARSDTPGSILTQGIDPIKHPTEKRLAGAGIDIAASFLLDPTMAAGKGVSLYKASQIGLDTIGDISKVDRALTPVAEGGSRGIYASRARNAMTSFTNDISKIVAAQAKGATEEDRAAAAGALQHIQTATPDLVHLIDDFTGKVRVTGVDSAGKAIMGEGDAITTLDGARTYLASKDGILRFMAGKAGAEIGYMPGQLSKFGVKALRANLKAGRVERGAAKLIDLNKPAVLDNFLAKPGDQVNAATGEVIADAEGDAAAAGAPVTTNQLASQLRAAAVDAGDKRFQSLKGPLGTLNRIGLTVQRAKTFLPRSTTFDVSNPGRISDIVNYAKTYLTSSDANLFGATYAGADTATRKAMLSGLALQVGHAAGLGTTEGGRELLATLAREFSTHKYSVTADKFVDDFTGMERDAALLPSDVNEVLTLPSFKDFQQAGAKIGVWQNTIGRFAQAPMVDNLTKIMKVLWLLRPANVVRNSGEDLFGAYLRGDLSHVLLAKRVAEENGLLTARTKLGNAVANPILAVTRMYAKHRIAAEAENLGLHYIAKLPPDELAEFADNFMRLHVGSLVDPNADKDIAAIHEAGLVPKRLSFNAKRTGFESQSAEGSIGAIRYSRYLGHVYGGNKDLVDTILGHLAPRAEAGAESVGEGDLATAAQVLREPKTMDDVIAALKADPRTKQMIRSTHYQDANLKWQKAVTDDEKDLAHRQLAKSITGEVRYLLTGQDGEINTKLADYLTQFGHAPSADWIEHNLSDAERPNAVLAPVFSAVPPKPGVNGWVEAAADLGGRAYGALVEKPINRISTMPIFLSNYGKMRVFLEPHEAELVAGGVSKEAADATTREIAMQMAMTRTLKYIDDPTLRTAMDVTGRNFFAFSRATTAFIRRWSTQLIEDPTRLRKAQLVHQAAVRTGVIYKDPNGGENFVYPGSGWAIKHTVDLGNMLGLNLTQVPGVVPNLTSQVGFLNPGLTNPMQMGLTPLANMPLREAEKAFPTHKVAFEKIDRFFNGSAAVNASLKSDLTPTFLRQFAQARDASKGSLTADSVRGMANSLAAAKQFPGTRLDAQGNPVPTNPAEMQAFLAKMTATAQNHMFLRATFGLFAPASPGAPTEESAASASDWFYGVQGIHGLSDEWKQMLNDAGGDYAAALQVWTELHPDKLMFTVPTTQVGAKSSTVLATEASNKWITNNQDFLKQYNTVGAYFLPQADQTGEFDGDAYKAELDLGLRQQKDLIDFANDVSTATASSQFYKAIAVRDQALADNADNPDAIKNIKANFSTWQDQFNKFNPLFAQTQQDFSASQNTAQGQLGALRQLVADPNVPKDVPKAAVAQMIRAYDTYHQMYDSIPGQTDAATVQRGIVGGNYDKWFQGFLKEYPQLGGLYAGVFRTLDNKILDPMGSQ